MVLSINIMNSQNDIGFYGAYIGFLIFLLTNNIVFDTTMLLHHHCLFQISIEIQLGLVSP